MVGVKEKKVCWLSAGVSSFVAGYLAKNVDEYIYIDIKKDCGIMCYLTMNEMED